MTSQISSFVARWLGFGSFATAIIVTSQMSIDPVNISKLLILAILAMGLIPILSSKEGLRQLLNYRVVLMTCFAFVLFSIFTIVASELPLSQNLFGYFGRNTGFLMYLFLLFCFIGTLLVTSIKDLKIIWYGFMAVGVINLIYCGIYLLGTDLISWNNNYGKILGTFGNPDFISAFLGMVGTALIAFAFGNLRKIKFSIPAIVLYVLTFIEIRKSSAIQGTVVLLVGTSIVFFLYLRSRTTKIYLTGTYVVFILGAALLALAGAFQRGPLSDLIYKTSISLRGVYWDAGIQIGSNHPIFGVGFDGYGDYYREFRSAKAMVFPGIKTVTNAAHNVVIDIFAFGGIPLLLAYLALILLILTSGIRVIIRAKEFDWIFASLFAVWVGYQLQTIVSINQIGVAVWGWVFGGCIIAYERISRENFAPASQAENNIKGPGRSKVKQKSSSNLFIKSLGGGLIGFLIVFPAFKADADWRSGLQSGDYKKLAEAALRQPMDSTRANKIAIEFERVGLAEQALAVTLKSTEFNPRSYDSWWVLFNLSKASDLQKNEAARNMRMLDPRNKNLE